MLRRLIACAALSASLFTLPAHATVDAFMELNVPYRELQTSDLCFMKAKMWAVIGIPPGSLMNGTFKPVYVFQEQNTTANPFVNINVLATAPALAASYVSDRWVGTLLEYRMKLDLSKYSTANGTTAAGRAKTVTAAKLAIIAMNRNLAKISRGGYRLWIQLVGLPSQTGLTGTLAYASTTSPYTSTSPLLLAYERELLNLSRSCQ